MPKDYAKFYEKQISLTEWFEAIGHPQAVKLRQEDNDKRERLSVLEKTIGLPFDKPVQFTAQEVADRTPAVREYLQQNGPELCAIRVMPIDPSLPKFRMRGKTVAEAFEWFDQQTFDATKYRVDFMPHFKPEWSTIFVVNNSGIFGDITEGWHYKLTQGTPDGMEAVTFNYDFKGWQFSKDEPGIPGHIQDVLALLKVTDKAKQTKLQKELGATFTPQGYLCGYFETTYDKKWGIVFIDYNRLLAELTNNTANTGAKDALVSGRCGSQGTATGIVRIVQPDQLETTQLKSGEILVCPMTTPDYLPLMQQASAVVTDLGGVLSHAAIVARELKKPCITGTKDATTKLKSGQKVTVDATNGVVLAA